MNRGFIISILVYLGLQMCLGIWTVIRIRREDIKAKNIFFLPLNLKLWKIFFPLNLMLPKFLHLLLITLSVIYSLSVLGNGGNQCPQGWQWHLGLFAVICGWTYLIFLSYKLPWIGVYAITFVNIVITFLKLAFFAGLLILASTIILRMVFF